MTWHVQRTAGQAEDSHRPGITLTETIVIVVALVVLTVSLLPAAAGVRNGSKAGRCLNNLAQIGYANTIYAALDAADMALPVHPKQFQQCPDQPPGQPCFEPIYVGAYEWGGKSGIGRDDFVDWLPAGDPLASKYGTAAGFGPASRPLNEIIFKEDFKNHFDPEFDPQGAEEDTLLDLDVYRCPSDTGYTGIHFPDFKTRCLSSFDHFGTSYNANIFMIANSDGGIMQSNSPYLHRLSDVISPVSTLAYAENNGRFAWSAAPEYPGCGWIGPGIPGTVKGWHAKDWTFNAAFVDGHVDTIYMRGYHNVPLYPSDDNQYLNYRCIIIRGEAWHVDTLPAELVPAALWFSGGGRPSWEDGIE